jgi:hypothetical protein
VDLKKHRDLSLILENMRTHKDLRYEFLKNRKLTFTGASSS